MAGQVKKEESREEEGGEGRRRREKGAKEESAKGIGVVRGHRGGDIRTFRE